METLLVFVSDVSANNELVTHFTTVTTSLKQTVGFNSNYDLSEANFNSPDPSAFCILRVFGSQLGNREEWRGTRDKLFYGA